VKDQEELLLDCIDTIYAAALDPDRWRDFLALLCQIAPNAKATMFLHDSRVERCDQLISSNWEDDYIADYLRYYASVNPWVREASSITVGRAYSSAELLPESVLRSSEFYADWLRPQKLDVGLALSAARSDERQLLVSALYKGDESDSDAERRRGFLQKLAPHLSRALKIHRQLADSRLAEAISDRALDMLPIGFLLIDLSGVVHFHNRVAAEFFSANDGIALDAKGHLELWAAPDQQRLARVIAMTSDGQLIRLSSHDEDFFEAARPSMRRPYSILVAPFKVEGMGLLDRLDVGRPTTMLLISDPERTAPRAMDWLSRAWGLTLAEARVATDLIAGARPNEIAEAHGLSAHTIRTQLNAVFAKSGCRSQAELVRSALRHVAMFAPPR
jgi:DNA-binding CsgD family transcriptional regulator/PAS domain-containing protein